MADNPQADNPHKGHRERMRTRILDHGMQNLADHELLEILLYYSIPMRDTNPIAHRIINEFGSLSNLLDADAAAISKRAKISKSSAVLISLIHEFMNRYYSERWKDNKLDFSSSDTVGEYAKTLLNTKTKECFYIFCLDSGNKLLKTELISEGIVNEAPVSIRDITEKLLKNNAASVILAHNHPGGNLEPSAADIELTRLIIHTLRIMNITVLDHIIVANNNFISFAKTGLIKNNFL